MQIMQNTCVASLFIDKNKYAIAIYQEHSGYIKTETGIIADINTIFNFIDKHSPQTILTNDKFDDSKLKNTDSRKFIKVHQRDYEIDAIQNNLLMFDYQIDNETQHEKSIKLHILKMKLDWNNQELIKCIGSLTYYLLQENLIDRSFKINRIIASTSNRIVKISKQTYEYLELIKEEIHPSLIKGKGRSKEGFTVYNLYTSYVNTHQGRNKMYQIFYKPTYNMQILRERYDTIDFIHKQLASDEKIIVKYLKKVHNLKFLLGQFENIKSKEEDWKKLKTSLENIIHIHRIFINNNRNTAVPVLIDKFIKCDMQPVLLVWNYIQTTLNLTPFQIKPGVNSRLDNIRNVYDNLDYLLTLYATSQDWDFQFKIVFMAQVGYLVKIPKKEQEQNAEDFQGWNLQFTNSSGNFYTNPLTQMLDSKYGDVYGEIQDLEKEVLTELQATVREHQQDIQKLYDLVGQFDCMLAMAKISRNFVRPKLSANNLIISNGWHILLGQKAINNNSFSYLFENEMERSIYNSQENLVNTNYTNRSIVLSGANGSGKTLYLKQTSIIVFLAHIGSFVPAQFAQIPLVDQIVSLNTVNSIYNEKCGFKQELFELNKIFKIITNRSFVVIDQIGHNTNHCNSMKVMYATLKYLNAPKFIDNQDLISQLPLLQRNLDIIKIPISIVITHLCELFNADLITQSYSLRYLNTLIYEQLENKEMVYLYKIKPGLYKKSHAIQSCRLLGLNTLFIDSCEEFYRNTKHAETSNLQINISKIPSIQNKIVQYCQQKIQCE